MTTLNIALPDAMATFVKEEAARGGYGGVNDYLHALLHREQRRLAEEQLTHQLIEGMDSGDEELTEEVWQDLDRRVEARCIPRAAS